MSSPVKRIIVEKARLIEEGLRQINNAENKREAFKSLMERFHIEDAALQRELWIAAKQIKTDSFIH